MDLSFNSRSSNSTNSISAPAKLRSEGARNKFSISVLIKILSKGSLITSTW